MKMKQLMIAVAAGFFSLTGTVYAAGESMDYLDYTDNIREDGSLIYYFEEVAVVLPEDWKGKFELEVDGTRATFYHTASREKWLETYQMGGGELFTLSYSVNHDFAELPDFSYIGFSEDSVMNYFLTFPTDFQAYVDDPAVAEEFQQMNEEIDFVKENAYMLADGAPVILSEELPQTESQRGLSNPAVKVPAGVGLSDLYAGSIKEHTTVASALPQEK